VAATVALPAAVPVKLTVQAPDVRIQLGALSEPVPVDMKVTVPVGVIAVPTEVSVTVTLQLDAWLITTGLAQVIAVEVERLFTTTLAVASGLAGEWVAAPP